MRAFTWLALFGIAISGCGQLNDDEELNPSDLASVEEASVAGCSITASTPFIGKCNPGDTFNSIVGKATVNCTTAQSSIKVTATLQKVSNNTVLKIWNNDFTCTSANTIDHLPPRWCFSNACTSVVSGSYNTFGSSPQGGGPVGSATVNL